MERSFELLKRHSQFDVEQNRNEQPICDDEQTEKQIEKLCPTIWEDRPGNDERENQRKMEREKCQNDYGWACEEYLPHV